MAIDYKKSKEFFGHDIWHLRIENFPRWQRWFIKILRIVILSIKDFDDKQLILRSSALTYYTLLSIVPVIAMIFGIAKGFGLEAYIQEQLSQAFASQPQVLESLLNYSHNMLQSTQGGLVAGLGFVLLLWAVMQILGNIENALNSVWHVKAARTWTRKFTDYLSIMIIAPVFIILSGVINIYISTKIQMLAEDLAVLGAFVKHVIIISIKFVPFISTWILFFLVYLVMPNTRVKLRSALLAGIVAGTFFQLFQWAYIEFQVGVSRYNAVYGSFASIPLFITWLYFSWTIVLIGAEISYSIQNVTHFEGQQRTKNISYEMRMLYHLHILHYIGKKFKAGSKAPGISEISARLDIPASLCRNILDNCIKAGLVVESMDTKHKEGLFSPGIDIAQMDISFILKKINGLGELKRSDTTTQEFQQIKAYYNDLEDALEKSPSNKNIVDL